MYTGNALSGIVLSAIVALGCWSSASAQEEGARLPVPNAADQAQSLRLIRDLYKKEFEQAVTQPQKSNLASKLFDLALATRQDPPGRYMLLYEAVRLAVDARDVPKSFRAIDEMAGRYRVNAQTMKSTVLGKMAESAKRPIENRNLAASAFSAVDGAIKSDEFDIAEQLAKVALNASRKARDGQLVRQITKKTDALEDLASAYRAIQYLFAILRDNPHDPRANLVVGRFYCFHKRDWDKGIPLLARGSDPVLSALAQRELKAGASADNMIEVADRWFEVADRQAGERKAAVLVRAAHWYNKALPMLSGLTKQRVERRLEQTNRSLAPTGKDPADQPIFAGPKSVIATDDHEGESGRSGVKNIYFLASRRPVLLNETAVFYQARGAAGDDTSGTISFSLDRETWIPIGKWTQQDMKAASARQNWHRVDFSGIEKEIRTNRLLIKFQYTSGGQKLKILRTAWSYEGE